MFHFVDMAKKKNLYVKKRKTPSSNMLEVMNTMKLLNPKINVRALTQTYTRQKVALELRAANLNQALTDDFFNMKGISVVNLLIESGDTNG